MKVKIEFDCDGFNPPHEEYIRNVLINWMWERGLFRNEKDGKPVVSISESDESD